MFPHTSPRPTARTRIVAGAALLLVGAVTTARGAGFLGDPALEAAAATVRDAFRRPPAPPAPSAGEQRRIALGQQLFFDTRLSGKGDLSCGSCHDPRTGWTDTLPTAVGTGGQVLGRRTQTLYDLATASAFFWDGRAETLEDQAMGPVQSPGEMNLPLEVLQARLAASPEYRAASFVSFGDSLLTPARAAQAIAAFERTISSPRSAFDRWTEGAGDAISDDAKRGFLLFTGKARCSACHSGWRFTDDSFHDIGTVTADRGRGAILEAIDAVQFAFKTPTLRGIVGRGPYMHDGSERDLAAVVAFYNAGGRVQRPSHSAEIRPLQLTAAEQRQLVAFLHTLGDARSPQALDSLSR